MAVGRHTCVACGAKSPETDLRYSLISLAGWRVEKEEGRVDVWRCPECWSAHKRKTMAKTQQFRPNLEQLRAPSAPEKEAPDARSPSRPDSRPPAAPKRRP